MAGLKIERKIIQTLPQEGRKDAPVTQKKKTSLWSREIEFKPAFGGAEKTWFFQMLSVLLESGLSILDAFEILIAETKKSKSKEVLEKIMASLHEGESLSGAFALQPKYFSTFEVFSIRMGESSGNMAYVLTELGSWHEKRQRLRRKFIQAFSYPIVVLVVAGAVLGFMMAWVVPMFEDIFKRFNSELPALTKAVLGFSAVVRSVGPFLLLGIVVGGILIYRSRNQVGVKKILSAVTMRIPLVGKLILKIHLSRLCYSFSLMLKSKVNLDQALELLEKVTTFYPIQSTLSQIRKDVTEGNTLHESFSKYKIYPPLMLQMIRVGERTAKLDKMLENLGKNLEDEGESGVASLTGLLEPILIVVLGLVVGVILISMYLPMFELTNTIK